MWPLYRQRMARVSLVKTVLPVSAAAVLGNAFVGRESMTWFQNLRRPRMQMPMPGFLLMGAVYYLLMDLVVQRADLRRDPRSYRLAMVVLAGNEIWNALFFGRQSTRAGFFGIVAFLVPLGLLQASVAKDKMSVVSSRWAVAPSTQLATFFCR